MLDLASTVIYTPPEDADGVSYRELGFNHFVERDRTRVAEYLARRFRELRNEVTITQAAWNDRHRPPCPGARCFFVGACRSGARPLAVVLHEEPPHRALGRKPPTHFLPRPS